MVVLLLRHLSTSESHSCSQGVAEVSAMHCLRVSTFPFSSFVCVSSMFFFLSSILQAVNFVDLPTVCKYCAPIFSRPAVLSFFLVACVLICLPIYCLCCRSLAGIFILRMLSLSSSLSSLVLAPSFLVCCFCVLPFFCAASSWIPVAAVSTLGCSISSSCVLHQHEPYNCPQARRDWDWNERNSEEVLEWDGHSEGGLGGT